MATKLKVLRLDRGGIRGGARVTTQGFLRLDAVFGRCGVLRYQQPDGSVRRELRLPEEVFAHEALESLEGAPITRLHGDPWVTRDSWRESQVGFVGDRIQRLDGGLVGGTATLQDEATVRGVLERKLGDLSPGYGCREVEVTPGTHELFGSYDAIQRGIIHNHVGIGPGGWGRQGRDVSVRLDGGEQMHVGVLRLDASPLGDFLRARIATSGMTIHEVADLTGIIEPIKGDPLRFAGQSQTWILESILEGWTPRPTDQQLDALARVLDLEIDTLIQLVSEGEQRHDGRDSETLTHKVKQMALPVQTNTVEIRLDGLAVDVPSRDADIIRKAVKDRDDEIASLRKGQSELQAKHDGLAEKLTKAEKDLAEAPVKVRAEIEGRLHLESTAKGFEVRCDGEDGKPLSARAIKEAVIRKLKPAADLAGKDDVYIDVRFDSAVEEAGQAPARGQTGGLRDAQQVVFAPPPATRLDSNEDDDDPEVIRRKNIAKQANAWRNK